MTVEQVARICYEANRVYCQSIGDNSFPVWEEAPDWQKNTVINGVELHMAKPDTTPEQSHENWLKVKEAEGWVYGPVKDADRKEHPCMLPYAKLPNEQKAKDSIFKGIVSVFRNIDPVPVAVADHA